MKFCRRLSVFVERCVSSVLILVMIFPTTFSLDLRDRRNMEILGRCQNGGIPSPNGEFCLCKSRKFYGRFCQKTVSSPPGGASDSRLWKESSKETFHGQLDSSHENWRWPKRSREETILKCVYGHREFDEESQSFRCRCLFRFTGRRCDKPVCKHRTRVGSRCVCDDLISGDRVASGRFCESVIYTGGRSGSTGLRFAYPDSEHARSHEEMEEYLDRWSWHNIRPWLAPTVGCILSVLAVLACFRIVTRCFMTTSPQAEYRRRQRESHRCHDERSNPQSYSWYFDYARRRRSASASTIDPRELFLWTTGTATDPLPSYTAVISSNSDHQPTPPPTYEEVTKLPPTYDEALLMS